MKRGGSVRTNLWTLTICAAVLVVTATTGFSQTQGMERRADLQDARLDAREIKRND